MDDHEILYPSGGGAWALRLSFSYLAIEQAQEGTRRLAGFITAEFGKLVYSADVMRLAHGIMEGALVGKSIHTLFDVRRNAGLLRRYVSPYRAQLTVLAVALLCSTGLTVLGQQLLGIFIDWTRSGASLEQLAQIAGIFIGVTVLAGLLFIGSEYLGARISWQATNVMRADLTAHCLSLDLTFYEDHPAGEMIDRIDGDIGRLAAYFSDLFIIAVSNLLLLFGIGVALLAQDWLLGICYTLPLSMMSRSLSESYW
jgi:ATP-binding cassette subfamily B protein